MKSVKVKYLFIYTKQHNLLLIACKRFHILHYITILTHTTGPTATNYIP